MYAALVFDYVRPQEYIPGLGAIPIAGASIYGFGVWGIFHLRKEVFQSPVVVVLAFGIIAGVSGIGAINVGAYKLSVSYILQVFPACAAIYVLVDTTDRLRELLKLWAAIYFAIAVITIANGGLGPGDFVRDPNDTSLALSMGLPYLVYLAGFSNVSIRNRRQLWVVASILVIAIIATRSRGGFVGLAGVSLGLWWLSQRRVKLAVIAISTFAVLGGAVLSFLPDGYTDELASIGDAQDDTRVERIRTWEIAWVTYKHNPVIGVGAGNFMYNAGDYQRMTSWWTGYEKSLHGRVTHSAYFQILSELGTVGVLVFGYVMFVMPLKLYRRRNELLKAQLNETRDFLHFQILMISMGAFLLSGAFISVAYYPHLPIWITMYAIILREARENELRRLIVSEEIRS